jgi:hypothetical protein
MRVCAVSAIDAVTAGESAVDVAAATIRVTPPGVIVTEGVSEVDVAAVTATVWTPATGLIRTT